MADACDACNLDVVTWKLVLPCILSSFHGVWRDLLLFHDGDSVIDILRRDDRVLYIVSVGLVVGMLLQTILSSKKPAQLLGVC
jgi:hypothetical protein